MQEARLTAGMGTNMWPAQIHHGAVSTEGVPAAAEAPNHLQGTAGTLDYDAAPTSLHV